MIYKSDITILDEILDKLLAFNSRISFNDFKSNNHFENLNLKEQEKEFERLVDYFEKYNCADSYKSGYHKYLKINQNTKKFKDNGGFNSIYLKEELKSEIQNQKEKLEIDLAKSNIEANKLNIENSKKNKLYTWINIIIGVLNLILLAIELLKD